MQYQIQGRQVLRVALALAGVLCIGGCGSNDQGSSDPWTINNPSLAGRPPWAMPSDATEEERLLEIRGHLEGIARNEPNTLVLGRVMLKRRISFAEFRSLIEAFSLTGGYGASVSGVFGPSADEKMGAGITWGEAQTLEELPTAFARQSAMEYPQFHLTKDDIVVNKFAAYTSTAQFLGMWSQYPDMIRGIVVGGRQGDSIMDVPVWIPGAGEPIR